MSAKCEHCHACGTKLKKVLDGEEWCPRCQVYRRYRSHGWTYALADKVPCLNESERAEKEREIDLMTKLSEGWYLTHDGFGGWALFAPGADFGDRIESPSSNIRNKLVEFGYRAANIASYRLRD